MSLARTEFRGTSRYELTSVLGAGGMGVVYEAFDRELSSPIALKYLPSTSPRAYLQFKREFRSLQDLEHENLVRLGQLVFDDPHVFFTMELVKGTDIVSFCHHRPPRSSPRAASIHESIGSDERTLSDEVEEVVIARDREAPNSIDDARVRSAFAQLVRGLQALHATHKVHRDIKPGNVLVTGEGRVVILDFGVMAETLDQDQPRRGVVGSVPYMAPEQATNGPISPATDFYAVGTMLYEVLTGGLPYQGLTSDVLRQKRNGQAPALSAFGSQAPADLSRLCAELLSPDPERRPSAAEILTVLERRVVSRATSAPRASLFVGRQTELATLELAYARAELGQVSIVHIEGVSGAGKSTLLSRYLDSVRARPEALVLRGRCSVRESVPYKAIDGVVDDLVEFLTANGSSCADWAVPSTLLRAFPGLARILQSELPLSEDREQDPYAQRRALFAAFRSFFERACRGRTVVVAIDDVHWADADSLALLTALLDPAPHVRLLVLTAGRHAPERGVRRVLGGQLLELSRLSFDDSVRLAGALLARSNATTDAVQLAQRIASEADGHPFLIDALTQEAIRDDGRLAGAARLDAALAARIERLDQRPRLMVQVAALAGGPLALRVLVSAAESVCASSSSSFLDLQTLQNDHWLRLEGTGGASRAEVYHDRIGGAVRATLPDPERRRLHEALATALERDPASDPGELAANWFGAGHVERAASHALTAADLAEKTLAFERAARLYAMALAYWPEIPNASELREKLGDALTNAGLGAQAAHAYIAASRDAGEERRLELERRAADQLFRSGHCDEAAPLIQRVLRPLGLRLPRSAFSSLVALLWSRLRLSFCRLDAPLRPESQVDPLRLRRLNACWSVAVGLAMVDNVRGAGLQTQHLILALNLGQPMPLLRALCAEAGYVAVSGHRARKRTERLLARADEVARHVTDKSAPPFLSLLKAMCSFLMGEWSRARDLAGSAESVFAVRPAGAMWELTNARTFHLWSEFYLGKLETMRARVEDFTREAEARGDRFAATLYRTGLLVTPWLASDEPDLARERVAAAELGWSRASFDFQRYLNTLGHSLIDLYQGAPELARRRISEQWRGLSRSMYLRIQSLRIEAHYFRGVAAVSAAARSTGNAPLLREARRSVAQLDRERTGASITFAKLLRAGLAEAERQPGAAELWREAEAAARSNDMQLFADSAAVCAAAHEDELATGEQLRPLLTRLSRLGVRNPRQFCQMLVPACFPPGRDWL